MCLSSICRVISSKSGLPDAPLWLLWEEAADTEHVGPARRIYAYGSQTVLVVKNPPGNAGGMSNLGSILEFQKDPLEEKITAHSTILA